MEVVKYSEEGGTFIKLKKASKCVPEIVANETVKSMVGLNENKIFDLRSLIFKDIAVSMAIVILLSLLSV